MYNYVIFGSDWDLYKISYRDLTNLQNCTYIETSYSHRDNISKFLYRIHFNKTINTYLPLPFKKIWNSGYFKNMFKNDNPLCFIFFSHWCIYEKYGLIDYLRKKYPGSRMVCFFQDLIALKKELDIGQIKKVFDLVLSFDHAECRLYGLEYHPLVFSVIPIELTPDIQKSDVYFLGKAKNRLKEIVATFELLKSLGLKCKFYLVGVEKDKQIYSDEIHYIESMSYIENLKHVVSSKCLIEIMQKNGYGFTQRISEAIGYNKKILTNNKEIVNAPFYNNKFISYFSEPKLIDVTFFDKDLNEVVDYNYSKEISPKKLFSFIEMKLTNNKYNE